jgi:hypothetical protein
MNTDFICDNLWLSVARIADCEFPGMGQGRAQARMALTLGRMKSRMGTEPCVTQAIGRVKQPADTIGGFEKEDTAGGPEHW